MAVRRSRGWPWNVLRLAVPLGKRTRSGVAALLMLCVEATGVLWSGTVLQDEEAQSLTFRSPNPVFMANMAHKYSVTTYLLSKVERTSFNKTRPRGVSQD